MAPVDTPPDRLALLEGRWTLRILSCLRLGEQRFSDLKTAIPGISPPVLIKRMVYLKGVGLVQTRPIPAPGDRKLYGLTPAGAQLIPALDTLARWQVPQRPNHTLEKPANSQEDGER